MTRASRILTPAVVTGLFLGLALAYAPADAEPPLRPAEAGTELR